MGNYSEKIKKLLWWALKGVIGALLGNSILWWILWEENGDGLFDERFGDAHPLFALAVSFLVLLFGTLIGRLKKKNALANGLLVGLYSYPSLGASILIFRAKGIESHSILGMICLLCTGAAVAIAAIAITAPLYRMRTEE